MKDSKTKTLHGWLSTLRVHSDFTLAWCHFTLVPNALLFSCD